MPRTVLRLAVLTILAALLAGCASSSSQAEQFCADLEEVGSLWGLSVTKNRGRASEIFDSAESALDSAANTAPDGFVEDIALLRASVEETRQRFEEGGLDPKPLEEFTPPGPQDQEKMRERAEAFQRLDAYAEQECGFSLDDEN